MASSGLSARGKAHGAWRKEQGQKDSRQWAEKKAVSHQLSAVS